MLIPSSIFYLVLIVFALFFGVPVFTLLSRKEVPKKISVIAGIFVIAIVVLFFNSITSKVIIIEGEGASRYYMYGTKSYDLSDGTTIEIEALDDGEFIINNTDYTCVIQRSDYRDYEVDDEFLLDIEILIPSMSALPFPEEDIDYLFAHSPDHIKASKRKSNRKLVKFELRPLTVEDKESYYLYLGPVKGGKPNGQGVLRLDSLRGYNGEFKDGLRHGEGVEKYGDGVTYTGEFVNGTREGYGEITYADSTVYKGDWKNDIKSGQGEIIYSNGDIYVGDFWNDQPEGQGKMTFVSGAYYEGKFVNGYFEGQGTYFHKDGSITQGMWEGGDLVPE